MLRPVTFLDALSMIRPLPELNSKFGQERDYVPYRE